MRVFFEFFDWKVKFGIALTVILAVGCVVSFIFAWTAPVPTDAASALGQYLRYRWFAFFMVSAFSIGAMTIKHYQKRLRLF